MNALCNGQPVAGWVDSRGLQYGDGVFRTILVHDGQPLDWAPHLQKLQEDCAVLGIAAPDATTLLQEAQHLSADHRLAVLKVLAVRQATGRGYRPATDAADRILLLQPAPVFPLTHWTEGIEAFRCQITLASQPRLAGVKHLNRLEQVLASAGWPQGVQEGLLTDQEQHPISGTRTNLFWVKSGQLFTPALDRCGVAGIMRRRILATAQDLRIGTCIQDSSWDELLGADEAFVCNALIGIWPLRRLERRTWRQAGVITRTLQNSLGHPKLLQ